MNKKVVRVGIGVVVRNKLGQTLLGKRKGAHGADKWASPGGHLEFGETPLKAAVREVKEGTGMTLLDAKQTVVTNDIFWQEDKHYITLFFEGYSNDEPQLLEPHKCQEWQWFDWNQLPQELFLSFSLFLEQAKLTHL